MKVIINTSIPQKSNNFKPDSVTIDNDDFDGYGFVDLTVYSEETKQSVTIPISIFEIYSAVKAVRDYAKEERARDKDLE